MKKFHKICLILTEIRFNIVLFFLNKKCRGIFFILGNVGLAQSAGATEYTDCIPAEG